MYVFVEDQPDDLGLLRNDLGGGVVIGDSVSQGRPALDVYKRQAEKLRALREDMEKAGAGVHILTTLDDIAWLLNLRGNDIECTPTFISYMMVTAERAVLYINCLLYTSAIVLALVGVVGYWDAMILTLSIALASVVLALVLGLPIGILISNSEKANRILRPVLDTMQTMPVFVYLIPALLLFGLGNASAVIATVIYAIVPVIRLTSLGIRQVDKEVVEAAKSFGSTRWQTLFKVQIPQAIPTIMTGVNQTLMMAMACLLYTSRCV